MHESDSHAWWTPSRVSWPSKQVCAAVVLPINASRHGHSAYGDGKFWTHMPAPEPINPQWNESHNKQLLRSAVAAFKTELCAAKKSVETKKWFFAFSRVVRLHGGSVDMPPHVTHISWSHAISIESVSRCAKRQFSGWTSCASKKINQSCREVAYTNEKRIAVAGDLHVIASLLGKPNIRKKMENIW